MGDEKADLDLLRRRMINVVGHELRTPITTLRGLAELLGTTEGDPEATEHLHAAVRRAARRAESLVDDLLVSAGVSTALPVSEPVPTDVVDAARAAWAELEDLPEGLDLELDVPDGLAVLIHKGGLRRALAAVLDNAVRYGALPVVLAAAVEGDSVRVAVRDAGPGIPAADRALAVEPFFRGERAVTAGPGIGMGLALAAALVAHHGGSLVIGEAEGGGAEVALVLPLAPAPP
ncbi:MAG: HAMP domain-containing histidine kinase [Acidimicrobiia bacterium]|nr:HAMP domain-containing histidine kinase [Acidimicrobiia bacterium]